MQGAELTFFYDWKEHEKLLLLGLDICVSYASSWPLSLIGSEIMIQIYRL